MSVELNKASRVVSARLPREQYDRVIELANASGQTRGEFIRDAVADAIDAADREDGE